MMGADQPDTTEDTFTQQLDSHVAAINFTRQSNTVSGIPLHYFRGGVSDLPKLKSQEFPAVILAIMVALGVEDKYLDEETTAEVQAALAGLFMLWHTLRRTWYNREEVETRLPALIER